MIMQSIATCKCVVFLLAAIQIVAASSDEWQRHTAVQFVHQLLGGMRPDYLFNSIVENAETDHWLQPVDMTPNTLTALVDFKDFDSHIFGAGKSFFEAADAKRQNVRFTWLRLITPPPGRPAGTHIDSIRVQLYIERHFRVVNCSLESLPNFPDLPPPNYGDGGHRCTVDHCPAERWQQSVPHHSWLGSTQLALDTTVQLITNQRRVDAEHIELHNSFELSLAGWPEFVHSVLDGWKLSRRPAGSPHELRKYSLDVHLPVVPFDVLLKCRKQHRRSEDWVLETVQLSLSFAC